MLWLAGAAWGAGLWLAVSELPLWWRRRQAAKPLPRGGARVWPAYFDDVASGLRAGLSLASSIWQAGSRLPAFERAAFARAQQSWADGLGLTACLESLADQIESGPFTAFAELVQLAATHGGSRLPTLVSELAEQTRSQLSLVDEVRARQATTVNAARVSVAAPWLVLAVTSTREGVRAAYSSATGATVLVVVAVVSLGSYQLMRRMSQIPALGGWR